MVSEIYTASESYEVDSFLKTLLLWKTDIYYSVRFSSERWLLIKLFEF